MIRVSYFCVLFTYYINENKNDWGVNKTLIYFTMIRSIRLFFVWQKLVDDICEILV